MGRVATEKKNPLRAAKRRHCSHAIEQGAALTRRYSRLLASWACKAHHCTTTSPQGAIRLRPRQAAGGNPPRQRTVTMPFCSARCIHKTDHTRGQFDPREKQRRRPLTHTLTHPHNHTQSEAVVQRDLRNLGHASPRHAYGSRRQSSGRRAQGVSLSRFLLVPAGRAWAQQRAQRFRRLPHPSGDAVRAARAEASPCHATAVRCALRCSCRS